MDELRPFVKEFGGTVIELGSRDGHDAARMAEIFQASRVITIEANPYCCAQISKDYPEFEVLNVAASNTNGVGDFYAVKPKYGEVILGQSSLLYKDAYREIANKIQTVIYTMDKVVDSLGVTEIECMKIDVEGATYEVLEGFTKIRMTRLFHIESEHKEFWEGQKLYDDTARFMEDAGYEQVYFAPVWTEQSDTIWRRID
jgi:FkbM family methyltransferase